MENFEFFALAYLNDWWQYDRNFVAGLLPSQSKDNRVQSLYAAANYYQVARRFPKKDWPGEDWRRFGPVLDLLDGAAEVMGGLTQSNVDQTVQDLAKKLGKTDVEISAASKFLWLRHKAPLVIYDDRAYKCLTQRLGSSIPAKEWQRTGYRRYREAWIEQFAKRKERISMACAGLARLKDFSPDDETVDNLNAMVTSQWFFERVFDKFLWSGGISRLRFG